MDFSELNRATKAQSKGLVSIVKDMFYGGHKPTVKQLTAIVKSIAETEEYKLVRILDHREIALRIFYML